MSVTESLDRNVFSLTIRVGVGIVVVGGVSIVAGAVVLRVVVSGVSIVIIAVVAVRVVVVQSVGLTGSQEA